MPLYEYVCRDCEDSFELRRPMGDADRDVECPSGHLNVRRKLSVFATAGGAATVPLATGGGCCGGACGCH